MTDLDFLTISAFARASRLSPKALRLYGDLGLLPPARVDDHNGYRLYSPDQLPTARLIALLRGLDLPLSDIRTLLAAAPPQRPERLRALWAQASAEHARRDALARYIQHHLQGDAPMTHFAVQTRQVPAQEVATLTFRVKQNELSRTIEQGMKRLHDAIQEQGAALSAAPFVIYHGEVNADSDGPVEVCWPYQGTLRPSGDLTLREEAAHTEAFVVLTKAQFEFPAILSAYDAVADSARAHGESGPLACREVYPYDWDAAGPNDPAGEVAWPYRPKVTG